METGIRLFIIDNASAFESRIFDKNNTVQIRVDNSTTFSVANDLSKNEKIRSSDILIININLKPANEFRQNHKGIELLTWLRIKGIMNHCILYSFQDVEHIARADKNNRVVFSKGTSFIRLPDDFSYLNESKISTLSKDVANNDDIKETIKPLFDIGAFRHREANWWGIKQLWDIHKIFTEGEFNAEYPQKVKDNLLSLNNAIGSYLHEFEIVSLNKEIEKLTESVKQIKENEKNELKPLTDEKLRKETGKKDLEESLALLTQKHLEILQRIMKYSKFFAADSNTNEVEKTEAKKIEDEAAIVNELIKVAKDELGETLSKIDDLNSNYRQIIKTQYKNFKIFFSPNLETEKATQAKILVIDDEATNGWVQIFNNILPKVDFRTLVPDKKYKDKIEELYKFEVKSKISKFNPDLILLDLRLFEEDDRSIDTDKLSGKQLLIFIREEYKSIPIMITTASNKIWTYQSLIDIGADAYWIKEGIDEQREVEDSIRNYCRLIFLVSRLTDDKYEKLKKLIALNEWFKSFSETNYWAETGMWATTTDPKEGDIDGIKKNFSDSIVVFRKYLHNYHLEDKTQNSPNETFFISGLINKIACVYENIHKLTEPQMKQIKNVIDDRKDTNSKDLRELRNKVSHYNYEIEATWENLENAIDFARIYLQTAQ